MLSWILEGVEYPLDTGEYCYLQGMDGLGMMPVSRIEESGPLQNGSTDRGYRLGARMITLALLVYAESQVELWQKRSGLIAIFKAGNTPGILRWTLGEVTREITGHFVDGLSFSSKDKSGWSQKTGVMIRCNDPAWYDPEINSIALLVSVGSGTEFTVPSAIPTDIGSSGLDEYVHILYEGQVDSFPIMRITGPIDNPIITNTVNDDKLDFTGLSLAAGEYLDIDLRYGYKTVTDELGVNQNDELTADSDLSTWRILAHPDAPNGENSIHVTGSNAGDATRIDITYYDLFSGI